MDKAACESAVYSPEIIVEEGHSRWRKTDTQGCGRARVGGAFTKWGKIAQGKAGSRTATGRQSIVSEDTDPILTGTGSGESGGVKDDKDFQPSCP